LRRPKIQETNYANQESDEEKDVKSTAVRCYVRIKGNPVVAILDSGAAVSIITKKLMKNLGLTIDETSNTVVVTANGERTRALGQIKRAQIAIQDLLIPISLQVIDSQDETLLLGTDWFRKTHASLDFGTNQIRLRYLAKIITVPITSSANETPVSLPNYYEQPEDELEQVLDDYEEEELSEIEAFLADSQEESEAEIEPLPLDYNPWNDENPVYMTLAFQEEFELNPAVFLAETTNENIWKVKDDLQVGPLDDNQQTSFQNLIDDYQDICALSQTKIGRTSLVKHSILTGNHDPVTTELINVKTQRNLIS
jgi:predicted aspartyl protease